MLIAYKGIIEGQLVGARTALARRVCLGGTLWTFFFCANCTRIEGFESRNSTRCAT